MAMVSRRLRRKHGNERLLCQSHIQDAALVKSIADACLFPLVHVQEIVFFLRLCGPLKILLNQARFDRGAWRIRGTARRWRPQKPRALAKPLRSA